MFDLHQFGHCRRIERCVETLNQSGQVTGQVLSAYHAYHFALIHKLRSAEHNLKRLEQLLQDVPAQSIAAPEQLFFEANMCLDGFFYCGGSALDILAREILSYFAIPLPNRVYYWSARRLLAARRPGDPLLPRLTDPPWRQSFADYRNTLTHELLLADNLSVRVRMVGAAAQQEAVFPLPDDPRLPAAQRTYNVNPNALEYSRVHFRRLVSHINTIYGELRPRIEANGGLPL